MCNPDPPNHFVSEYSLPHAAATMEVRGHAGHDLNERADELAREAIAELRAAGRA